MKIGDLKYPMAHHLWMNYDCFKNTDIEYIFDMMRPYCAEDEDITLFYFFEQCKFASGNNLQNAIHDILENPLLEEEEELFKSECGIEEEPSIETKEKKLKEKLVELGYIQSAYEDNLWKKKFNDYCIFHIELETDEEYKKQRLIHTAYIESVFTIHEQRIIDELEKGFKILFKEWEYLENKR